MSSPRPFEFDDEPERRPATSFDPDPDHERGPGSKGRAALIVAVVAGVIIGALGFARTAAILGPGSADAGVLAVSLTVISGAVALVALVVSLVAIVRSRPGARLLPAVALVIVVVLPWVTLWLGQSLARVVLG